MSGPTSRTSLVEYCLRKLGHPVLNIYQNLDDDQISDRIDDAFQYFQDYHFDATEQIYMKHLLTDQDVAQQYIDLTQSSGVAVINANSVAVLGQATNFADDFYVGGNFKVGSETKTVVSIQDNTHMNVDTVFANSYDHAPIYNPAAADLILGVTKIFPLTGAARVNMFDLNYQIRLNDLYSLTSTSYVNYVITQQHIRTMEMIFSGEQPIRFNRHQKRLFIDTSWGDKIMSGMYIIVQGYKILDPDQWTEVYNDRLLKRLATAYIKRQLGTNLSKFNGMTLPGGVILNGQKILDEATKEVDEIEALIESSLQEPPMFFIG